MIRYTRAADIAKEVLILPEYAKVAALVLVLCISSEVTLNPKLRSCSDRPPGPLSPEKPWSVGAARLELDRVIVLEIRELGRRSCRGDVVCVVVWVLSIVEVMIATGVGISEVVEVCGVGKAVVLGDQATAAQLPSGMS